MKRPRYTAGVAVIGGTGIYDMPGISKVGEWYPETSWGFPSDKITIAEFSGANGKVLNVAFLPRHGRGHFIAPGEINQRANLAALKLLGVEEVISFSAVGSLKEEIAPGHFILPDQIIDRTRHRPDSFFGNGIVVHVSFGEPFSPELAVIFAEAIRKAGIPLHQKETLICMEGPQFSTRAESRLYKSWGAGIINMSVLPEAKLARELEMAYQMICMSTDYDSWRESEEVVNAEEIMKVVSQNSANAVKVLKEILEILAERHPVPAAAKSAVRFGIITAPEKRRKKTRRKLNRLFGDIF